MWPSVTESPWNAAAGGPSLPQPLGQSLSRAPCSATGTSHPSQGLCLVLECFREHWDLFERRREPDPALTSLGRWPSGKHGSQAFLILGLAGSSRQTPRVHEIPRDSVLSGERAPRRRSPAGCVPCALAATGAPPVGASPPADPRARPRLTPALRRHRNPPQGWSPGEPADPTPSPWLPSVGDRGAEGPGELCPIPDPREPRGDTQEPWKKVSFQAIFT